MSVLRSGPSIVITQKSQSSFHLAIRRRLPRLLTYGMGCRSNLQPSSHSLIINFASKSSARQGTSEGQGNLRLFSREDDLGNVKASESEESAGPGGGGEGDGEEQLSQEAEGSLESLIFGIQRAERGFQCPEAMLRELMRLFLKKR